MGYNVELEINRDELSVNHLKNNWRSGEVIVNFNNTLFSTISWVEANDGGDPKIKTDHRDIVYTLSSPFNTEKKELVIVFTF